MAYNLQYLIQILDEIMNPYSRQSWVLDQNEKPQIESLLEKVRCLNELLENSSSLIGFQCLERRITGAVYEAEDVLESHLVDQLPIPIRSGLLCVVCELFSRWRNRRVIVSPLDLWTVIEKFDFVNEEVKKMMDRAKIRGHTSSIVVPMKGASKLENIVEGLSKDLIQLKDRLTNQQSKREIIPIVGMGGIGKTTLTRNLYIDPLIVEFFDKRAWATISQNYDLKQILLSLLQCLLGILENEMKQEKVDKLALHIHQALYGRRYLIVLDDMWSSETWDEIKMYFPDDKNGSRIVVTTREVIVANYVCSKTLHHQMSLLNEVESWNLLRRKVFAEETCPPELERDGKKIANACCGLPLAIHVVGGLLAQLDRSQIYWQHIAKDVRTLVAKKVEQFTNILSLSYKHLPNHLRPCFHYIGAFPEDYEIRPSKLIKLWVAEGFVKPIMGKSLEEAAELYLKELVDRNLLSILRQEINGNVKSYVMHDMLRDLSIRKAQEEKFLCVTTSNLCRKDMQSFRRHGIHSFGHLEDITWSTDLRMIIRSIIFIPKLHPFHFSLLPFLNFSELKLCKVLRVLDILSIGWNAYLNQLEKLVNLRYLAVSLNGDRLYYRIPILCNLQTLIVSQSVSYWFLFRKTSEIFNMINLRHIKFKERYLLLDLPHCGYDSLQELQTLSTVAIDNNFPEAVKAFPNLTKLGMFWRKSLRISSTIDLTYLNKLETLKCSSDQSTKLSTFLSFIIFPPSLKRLHLRQCRIPSGYMERVGKLPNLEVLKLHDSAFESATWEPTEGEFCKLRFLLFEKLNLVDWPVDATHYPRLECLIIRDCSELNKIPLEIGEISTLQTIEVHGDSNPFVIDSARKIQDEQLGMGNNLQVRIYSSSC